MYNYIIPSIIMFGASVVTNILVIKRKEKSIVRLIVEAEELGAKGISYKLLNLEIKALRKIKVIK